MLFYRKSMDDAISNADKLFKYGYRLSKKHSAFLSASAAKQGLDIDGFTSDDDDN